MFDAKDTPLLLSPARRRRGACEGQAFGQSPSGPCPARAMAALLCWLALAAQSPATAQSPPGGLDDEAGGSPKSLAHARLEQLASDDRELQARAWQFLLEMRAEWLPVLADFVNRDETVRAPSECWYPESVFTTAGAPRDGACSLGHVARFLLRLATGREGREYDAEDWRRMARRAVGRLNGEQRPREIEPDEFLPVRLDLPVSLEGRSGRSLRRLRDRVEQSPQLQRAFAGLAEMDLARQGIPSDGRCTAVRVSEDLQRVWGVVQMRRGVTEESAANLFERAARAGIDLREIGFWNPEERVYEIDRHEDGFGQLSDEDASWRLVDVSPGTVMKLQNAFEAVVAKRASGVKPEPRLDAKRAPALRTQLLGRVEDARGFPVSGADIQIASPGTATPGRTRTDANGLFQWETASSSESHSVTILHPDYEDGVWTSVSFGDSRCVFRLKDKTSPDLFELPSLPDGLSGRESP